jgi:hypothetical protein
VEVIPMTLVDEDVAPPVFAAIPPAPGGYEQLDDFDIVELARSARRLASWATSIELGAIAELSARRKAQGEKLGAWDSEVGDWVTDEVAAALTLSCGTAAHRVVMAEQLATTLPLTFLALRDGSIDADKTRVIADGLRGVPPQLAGEVERQVLPAAPAQTCAQLRYTVRKAIRDIDPDGCAARRELAEDARRLELWDSDAGTSDLTGRDLPAAAATAAWNRINAIAAALKADGDPRTIDQLRADVFVALLRNERPAVQPTQARADAEPRPAPSPGTRQPDQDMARGPLDIADAPGPGAVEEIPRVGGQGSSVVRSAGHEVADGRSDVVDEVDDARAVAVAVAGEIRDQLTGLSGGLSAAGRQRGGQAALVREAVRRIKAATAELNSRWCTTAIDGSVVRHGADSYRAPARMRWLLEARDGTCRFPGCRRKAVQCDADHTEPHHKGGVTCPCNLAILCRRHHRLKQRPEWQLIQVWHGVLVWIAPTGHWYVIDPGTRDARTGSPSRSGSGSAGHTPPR